MYNEVGVNGVYVVRAVNRLYREKLDVSITQMSLSKKITRNIFDASRPVYA
jgi:hypothetical protein